MRHIDASTVQLSDAEIVIKAWHDSLLDKGLDPAEATREIMGNLPDDGLDNPFVEAMDDEDFLVWLSA